MLPLTIGIVGEVSVGKTTILNGLIGQYIGETKRKRTTFVPFKFNHQKSFWGLVLWTIRPGI